MAQITAKILIGWVLLGITGYTMAIDLTPTEMAEWMRCVMYSIGAVFLLIKTINLIRGKEKK